MDIVRPAGWISKVGWGKQPFGHSLDPIVQKNVTLKGSFSHNWPIWERVIRLLDSGMLDVGQIIGGIWPLDDGTRLRRNALRPIVKAVLTP